MNKRLTQALQIALTATLIGIAPISGVLAQAPAESTTSISIPAGDLHTALKALVRQTGAQLLYDRKSVEGLRTKGVRSAKTAEVAIKALLEGTALTMKTDASGAILIAPPTARQRVSIDQDRSSKREDGASSEDRLALAQTDSGQDQRSTAAVIPEQASAAATRLKSSDLEEIIVTAPRLEATARAEEFRAPNLINVQSAEQIAKFPDFDAAEAAARVPGISLTSDTGEGRFVNIRGIDNNLNGTTFGGVVLLNTQPQGTLFGSGRGVELDTIPVGSIDRIVITKTGLPDHDAEGLGGSIELTPRSAAAIKKPLFAEVTLGGGYEPLRAHNYTPIRADVTIGGRFGLPGMGSSGGFVTDSEPFSFVLTASKYDDKRAVDDIEPFYAVDAGYPDTSSRAEKVLDSINFRRYNYHRRRSGVGGDFEFQPNERNRFYLRANVAGYIESVNNQQFHYTNLEFDANGQFLDPNGDPALGTALVDPNNPKGFLAPAAGTQLSQRSEEETHRNTVVAIGGKNDISRFTLDYQVAYSRAIFSKDNDYNPFFGGPSASLAYDNTTDVRYPKFNILDGTDPHDPTKYNLLFLFNAQDQSVDYEWSGQANLGFPVHLINDQDRLKFGVKVRLRNKFDRPTTQTLFPTVPVPLTNFIGAGPFTNFYGGRYNIGVNVDAVNFKNFFLNNQNLFMENVAADQAGDAGAFFRAKEDIYAGYGQYETTMGPWGLLAGVRVEQTNATYAGNVVTTTPDPVDPVNNPPTRIITPTSKAHDYINPFPTAQLRYQINPEMILRATYSTGIGRPGFTQIAPTTQVILGVFPTSVAKGNPDLKPITGDNFDLSYDYNSHNSLFLHLGVFDKEIKNYVVGRSILGPFPGVVGEALVTTFVNAPTAYVRGVEASYTQTFNFLPAPFDGLGVNGNVTLVDSSVLLREGEKHLLPATSKVTANASIFYDAHGLDIQLSAQEVGRSLSTIGAGPLTDVTQAARLTMDLTSSYKIRDFIQVYFNAKNLLNTPLRFDEGRSDRPIQREFYDVTLETGVRLQF